MKSKLLAIGLVCSFVFLYFWFLTPHSQATERPLDQPPPSTSSLSDLAHAQPAIGMLTTTLYLPSIASSPINLYGYVIKNGLPVNYAPVYLWLGVPPSDGVELGSDTTDANGRYDFASVPSISCDPGLSYCPGYYIEYFDPAFSPDRLVEWETTPITNHVQDTAQQFPTFDIGAPELIFPNEGDVVSPTITFTWIPRPFPDDNYEVEIGPPNLPLSSGRLGYTNAYTRTFVGNNCGGAPCYIYYNIGLYWHMTISTSAGYGHTWAAGLFTITAPSQTGAGRP